MMHSLGIHLTQVEAQYVVVVVVRKIISITPSIPTNVHAPLPHPLRKQVEHIKVPHPPPYVLVI